MTPRLVACDLDGTLLAPDGTVSARTAAAVAAVEACGVPFVIVTGRPPRWLAPVVAQLDHRGLAVCANGALLYDLHSEQVVASSVMAADAAAAVVAALRHAVPGVTFAAESERGFGHEPAYRVRWETDATRVASVQDLYADGVVKLLVRHEDLGADALLAAARDALGDLAEATHSSTDGLLELSAVGVSKASGLASYAASLGVDAAGVVAFGDMPNDIPMLTWAGHGVAMAGAHPEVLAVADEVTVGNEQDGVAAVLERWF